jgi:type IX secretion system PorP/SprF family membrane protein
MRKRLATLAIIGLSTIAFGQQMPQFSQYLRNQYMVNPGAAGVYDFVDVTLGGRMQWVGFDNAPLSSYIYVSSPLSKRPKVRYNPALRTSIGPVRNPEIKTGKLKHALGGMVIADQYGAFRQLKGAITYALHIPVSQNYNLSFGANVGLSNRSFLSDRAQTLNLIETTLGYTDPTYDAYAQSSNLNTIDIGAGLYFYSDRLFLGVSADQLTRDFISFGGTDLVNVDPKTHVKFTAGYKFPISDNLTLTPAILGKFMQPAPVSLEGSLQLEYKEWLWFALSYRQGVGGFNNSDAAIIMAGLNISERFKFGYSFDYSISQFNQHSSGGHELVLGLMLGR